MYLLPVRISPNSSESLFHSRGERNLGVCFVLRFRIDILKVFSYIVTVFHEKVSTKRDSSTKFDGTKPCLVIDPFFFFFFSTNHYTSRLLLFLLLSITLLFTIFAKIFELQINPYYLSSIATRKFVRSKLAIILAIQIAVQIDLF